MGIIRVEKTKNYSVISNVCLRDDRISMKAKGLFAYIMTLPDSWEVRQCELLNHFSDGRTAISAAMHELGEFGYITKHRVRNEGGMMTGWEYTLYEHPITDKPTADAPTADKPKSAQPKSGFPKSDKPKSENLHLLNTEGRISTDNTKYYTADFEKAWNMYGRYGAKAKALAYWNRLAPEDRVNILSAIPKYMRVVDAGRKKKQFEGWINPANRLWEQDWTGALREWNRGDMKKPFHVKPTGGITMDDF